MPSGYEPDENRLAKSNCEWGPVWGLTLRLQEKYRQIRYLVYFVAERVGFEPTVRFPAHTLSKRAP
jgi:hypothetical protein